jgi:hypothetical protein
MSDAQEQKVVGADSYVASMREAVDAALAALGKPKESVAPEESRFTGVALTSPAG